jgi:hypothetical protein
MWWILYSSLSNPRHQPFNVADSAIRWVLLLLIDVLKKPQIVKKIIKTTQIHETCQLNCGISDVEKAGVFKKS